MAGEPPPTDELLAREQEMRESLTLGTMCACGHTRKDHRGLRMEVCGPCLECDCEEFRQTGELLESEMLKRLRAAVSRVERLEEIVADLPDRSRVHRALPQAHGPATPSAR